MFGFYKAQNTPTGLSTSVGGPITSNPLSGYLNELFTHTSAPPSGTTEAVSQYVLVYVKNEYGSQLANVRVYTSDLEHPEQIALGLASGSAQAIPNKIGAPENVSFVSSTNYLNGIDLGTMSANSASGVWVQLTLSGISNDDPYATFRLYAGGQAQ